MNIRNFFKRWPTLYYIAVVMIGPAYFGGINPRTFIKRYASTGHVLNIGSGPRRLATHVVNVDVEKYEGVDVVGSVESLPFETGSVDAIICDTVLEHVRDVGAAASEMSRVVRPGGFIYISTPFLYPFHESPSDYWRFTTPCLQHLFTSYEPIAIGVRSGPFSALSAFLAHTLGSWCSFGSRRAHDLFVHVWLVFLFPLKFLDSIANHLPFAEDVAAIHYFIGKKKHDR